MTRISRPSAPLAHGKGGTRGLDTTDTSPGARHPAMLDDYLRTHEAGPASHAIWFPRGSACSRYGTTTGRSSILGICYACWMDLDLLVGWTWICLALICTKLRGRKALGYAGRLPYPRSRAGIPRDTVPPWASLS